MKIAVIGAGFMGLALSYYLQKTDSVYLFDEAGIGNGASGVAAGLVHPFAGLRSRLSLNGKEAYNDACDLFDIAEKALGKKVAKKNGIFRPITNSDQERFFLEAANQYDEIKRQTLYGMDGIFIKTGAQVNCPLYLEGLFLAGATQGVQFEKKKITNIQELSEFDLCFFTVGAATDSIKGLENVAISKVKGAIIELETENDYPVAMSARGYIAQNEKGSLICGSTYEHHFTDARADKSSAEKAIREKVIQFCPELENAKLLDCQAGIRASTKDKLPLVQKITDQIYYIGGLGSKGLLYHAYIAKNHALQITNFIRVI